MLADNRIRYFASADYTEGSALDELLKMIIDKTSADEKLEELHYRNKRESEE